MVYYINYWVNHTVVHSIVIYSGVNYFPCQRVDARMSTDVGAAEGTEARELVHFVTQQTRFTLLNNILQHPDQLPSMYELEQLNPSISDATVYKHIQKLIDAGIVEEAALPDDQRRQGCPWKFYGVSDEGREFLDEHNLLEAEETLQRIYETISDKPEKMIKYENAPRPR
jgi:DNA-binding MarR family transcriptional regulator